MTLDTDSALASSVVDEFTQRLTVTVLGMIGMCSCLDSARIAEERGGTPLAHWSDPLALLNFNLFGDDRVGDRRNPLAHWQ